MNRPLFHVLTTGYKVAYQRLGQGSRKAFFLHGFPGSFHQGLYLENFCAEFDLQVITFNRPGYGGSENWRQNPSLGDISQIFTELARLHSWDQFHIIAVSGGTPYAIRAAVDLSKKVLSLNVVCGLGILNEPEFKETFSASTIGLMNLANRTPERVLNLMIQSKVQKIVREQSFGKGILPGLFSADRETLANSQVSKSLAASLGEAFSQGASGAKRDLQNYLGSWQVPWAQITCPTHFWHGDKDGIVPCANAEIYHRRIPHSKLTMLANEGHYSLAIRRMHDVLTEITRLS